jgi:hypothetical protein
MYFYPHSGIQILLAGAQFQNHVIRILLAGEDHKILLAGGRTTKVQHRAIRMLLAGGRTVQVTAPAVPSEDD